MNANDRRRISTLINGEFRARRDAAAKEPTAADIAKEVDSIITKNRLRDKVTKLTEARKQVATLEKQLSVAAESLRKSPRQKRRRYNDCECHEDYVVVLDEVATESLRNASDVEGTLDKLFAEERRLLARVEIAMTTSDLGKIAHEAGLI